MQFGNVPPVATGNSWIDTLNSLIASTGTAVTAFDQARAARQIAKVNVERLRAGFDPFPSSAAYPDALPAYGYGGSMSPQTRNLLLIGGGLLLVTLLAMNLRGRR